MVRRVLLSFSVAAVAVCVACGSFGTAPVETPDGGVDANAPAPDASLDAGGPDAVVPPPECATPLETNPNVAAECAGRKVYLASDGQNCGRCGYSCGNDSCLNGLCVARKEAEDIEALLGVSNGMALVSSKVQIRGYSKGSPQPLADLTNEVPVNAVFSKSVLFFRTNGTLRNGVEATPYAIEGNAPFLAPSPTGVVTSAGGQLYEATSMGGVPNVLTAIPSPREIVAVGSDYVVYSATSAPSLRLVSGQGTSLKVTELVANVGKISALQGFGDYAYFARGREVFRVKTPAGSPELVATSTMDIQAYVGGPALSVTAEALRFLGSSNGTDFTLFEQEACPGATPRAVAKLQNSKGVLVTSDRVYWSESTNQLYSRAIAKKP